MICHDDTVVHRQIVDAAHRNVGPGQVKRYTTGETGQTSLGVIADRVLRVREMVDKDVEPVPETLTGWKCEVAGGMLRTEDGIAMILDIDKILCADGLPGPFDFG